MTIAHRQREAGGRVEIEEVEGAALATFVVSGGRTLLCLVKVADGLHVYRNEEPAPAWVGADLAAYIAATGGQA